MTQHGQRIAPAQCEAAEHLVALANEPGGSDNVTVVVVRIGGTRTAWLRGFAVGWLAPPRRL